LSESVTGLRMWKQSLPLIAAAAGSGTVAQSKVTRSSRLHKTVVFRLEKDWPFRAGPITNVKDDGANGASTDFTLSEARCTFIFIF
jgi:hypothetical protein